MSKIRTQYQLQEYLDTELGWRIKEIANLKSLLKTSQPLSQKTAARAAVPLLYAHWEGFIKNSAKSYLEFINNQRLRYSELESCFIVFGLKKKLNELIESKKSQVSIEAVEFLRNEMNSRCRLNFDSAIRTDSNLSSEVFSNISLSIGFDTSSYEGSYKFIDESLLKRRNHIAHGDFLEIDADGFTSLADRVIKLLRMFKTDIENSISQATYKI